MEFQVQSIFGGAKQNAHPAYQQGQRPPRMPSGPPPYMPNQQPNSYQTPGYNHQNRPNPPNRPPPPPFINGPGGNYGRGRPYDSNFARQNDSEFVDNRNVPNQRYTGGRGGYGSRGRGHGYQPNNYNDGSQPQGRQDNYQQRQGRDQQNFNRRPFRNQEQVSYQPNRNQRASFNNNRSSSPNFQPNQRQSYQGYQRGRNQQRPNYQRNRVQQQTEDQPRPRQRNYEQQPRQRQYQRNDYPSRATVRGRGRGGQRGRGRGRGRQFPQRQVEVEKEQKSIQESQSASGSFVEQRQSQIQQQEHQNQSENAQSQNSGSMQQAENSQQQEAQSENQDQNQEKEESEVQVPVKRNGKAAKVDEADQGGMQRIDVMCSRQQFQQRLQTFKMNNRGRQTGLRLDTGRSFAIFQINKRTNEPDIALTLKRFRRSTNRGEDENEKDQTADCPRSRKGLTLTLKHILKEIIDSDGMRPRDLAFPLPPSEQKIQFLHIYDFLWNRMRQMIKDVSRLQIRDRDTQEVITICEQMLRFFIIAVKEGRQPHTCRLQFDPKMNLQSITKILTQLLQIYQNNHNALSKEPHSKAFISPNQPEIMAYAILISHDLQNTLYQKLRLRVDGYGIGHPLLNCREINRALQIKKALKMRDYQSFYKILESQQTDYLQACLLIHHLPMVRRQTLKIFQKCCEVQVSTKAKKIPLSILKRNLRFSNKLNKEFREFISSIGLKIVSDANQNYAILNEFNESLQDYISSYAFDFPQNKEDRKFYPNSKKKATLINANVISREQLIKREWYQGSYVDECNAYYNKSQAPAPVEQEEQKLQKPQIVYSQKVLQHIANVKKQPPIIVPQLQKAKQKYQFLLNKKKEFARSKFLKSLQGLIRNLVKKSDVHSQHQRKCGLQILFEFIQMLQIVIKQKAFTRMYQYTQNQKITIEALQNMRALAAKRKNLLSTLYTGCFEFSSFASGIQYNRLSKIVNYKSKKSFNLLNQLNLLAENYPRRKQLKVLLLFVSSNQLPLEQMHVQFLKNLILYMSGETSSTSNLGKQVEDLCQEKISTSLDIVKRFMKNNQQSQLKLTFYHSRIQSSQHQFFCGYDSLIFVDLHNDSKVFKKMIGHFIEKRKNTMQSILGKTQKLSLSIAHLVVAKIDKLRQKDSNTELKELQQQIFSKHLLQQQSNKLSSTLRQTILQVLNQSMRRQQLPKVEFEEVPLTNLISQIQQNLSFAESACKEPLSIVLFQNYLKANIKCISNAIKKMTQNYQRHDWKDFLLQLSSSKPSENNYKVRQASTQISYPEQQVDLNYLLSRKLQFSNQLTFLLHQTNFYSRFQNKMKEMPYITYYRALADAIQDYLTSLCLQSRPYALQLICQFICEKNCALENKQGKIVGQCKALIHFIFVQLKKALKNVNIILPKDFKFKISKDILQNKPLSRKSKKIQKQIEVQTKKLEKLEEIRPKNPFNYKHQNLLKRLSKQLEQDFEQENLRNNPQKAIKI